MACGCGKPKCNGKCGISPAVLQINNSECTLFHRVDVPASMGDSTENPPKNGAYRNVLLYYEADENAFLYNSDGIPTRVTGVSTDYNLLRNKPSINDTVLIGNKTLEELGIIDAIDTAVAAEAEIREDADETLQDNIDAEEGDRIAADNALWDEIETIEAASDVVDVVGTYAELEAYDTSKLHDNDLIKVLQDETRDDAITYYRWSTTTETFSYVGSEGPYYTQSETDTLLDAKQDKLIAGSNIQIAADGKTISATDTTYTAGSGLNLSGTEFSVDTTTIQEKLTAGTNVQISNQNVISATDTTYTAGTGLNLTGTEFSVDTTVIAEKSDLPTKTSDLTNDGADGTSTYAETDELPTKTSDLTNDGDDGTSPYATQDYVDTYGGKIDKIEVNGVEQSIVDKTVDITVPTKTSDITNDGSDGTSTYVEADELATVATTGSYTDLSNTPTIGNATLTIQKNSSTIDTFTANATSDKTIDISVPTDTSDLTNDGDGSSPFATEDYVVTYGGKIDKIEVNGVEQTITNKTVDITVPTKTSDITNDGSDGTSTYVENDDLTTTLSGYQEKLTAGSNVQISNQNVISATDTTYSDMVGADASTAGSAGLVPAPAAGDNTKYLSGDGTWKTVSQYQLPIASASTLGGIKVGDDLTINSSTGALSVDSTTIAKKTDIGNATLTIQKNGTSAGTFTANATSNKTINITVPTTAADVSALPASTKYGASLTMSIDTTDYKITTTLKDQDGNTLGTAQVIDLPLESVVVSGSFDSVNKKIVLTLENGNTVDIPVGDLVSGLQTEITAQNMLDADLVDDSTSTNKFTTAADITKLAGIATGAEVNVQSDWNVSDSSSDAFIKNKPTIPDPTDYYWANVKVSDTSKTNTTPTFAKGTFNTSSYPQVAGANSILTFSATGNWDSASGPIVLNTTSFRPSSSASNVLDLGASNAKWKNLYMDGNIYKGSYTLTLPSKTGTVALTSDIPAIDSALSDSSTNPVQNKVIKEALDGKNKTIWTDWNISPDANTPASWKTKLGGEGIYWTWYNTSGKFTNQPSQYGFLRTVIGSNDVRQDFWVQTSGTHYYRPGNGTGWYGQSGNAGLFRVLGDNVDTALSTTSGNPVRNSVITNALNDKADVSVVNEKVNFKRFVTEGSSLYKKVTVTGYSTSSSSVGVTIFGRDQIFMCQTMAASGYMGALYEIGTNYNGTAVNTNNRHIHIKMKNSSGTPPYTTFYIAMDAYVSCDIYTSGEITVADSDATEWNGITSDVTATPIARTSDIKNATLTIQKNGTTVQTFTANQSSNATANITVPIVDSTLSDTSTNAVENQAVTTKINEIDRFYRGLVPLGTAIAANKDLNTTEFLKVGKYYCSTNATVATLTNCPTGTAFMMEVFSPLSTTIDNETTGTWVYRMRVITELDGDMWYQGCNSNATANNWTYGTWYKVAKTADIGNATLTIQKNGTNVQTFTANATSNKTCNITVPTKISDLSNTSGGFVTFCTCSSAADATTKTATVDSGDSNWTLRKGTIVGVKYTNTNTASATKLNVGGTGDKSVYYNTAVYTGTSTIIWGNANRFVFYMYDGTNWVWISDSRHDGNDNTYTTAYCNTAAGTAAKTASMTGYVLTANRYTVITFTNANTSASAITLNINGKGAKPLYINGAASSASNYSFAAGSYIVWYNGTNYYLDTSGNIPRTVHPVDVAAVTDPTGTVTNSMIADGTLTYAKTATGEFLKLQLSTVDIGEGASLAPNTLYGVYE